MQRIDDRTPRAAARWPAGRRLAALLILAAPLAGCRPAGDRDVVVSGEPVAGGTAVVGMRADFGGFNPITATDIYTDEVNKYALFTPLVQYDEDLTVRPYLAESWELAGDTAIVFRLRRDVRWHDGRPVTAEDVKFTFDLAKAPATASLLASAYLGEVERAEVLDPYTIRFDFARPFAQAVESFWWAPVPKHLLESVPAEQLRSAEFNRSPVGSGPYRFVEWRAGDRLVLERNAEFPAALGGPPHLDRVVFRIIPEPPTMLAELFTGGLEVDIPAEPDQAAQIRASPELELFAFPGRTVYYVGWNNGRPPFDDATVRRAMTLAIDRGEVIGALLEGYGTPATGPIPPWSPLDPAIEPLAHDPGAAAALLERAGWVDRTGDGIRESATGAPLRFTLMTSDRPLNRAAAEVIQAQLRRVGAAARIQVLEFQTLLARHRARDYEAVFSNWVLDNFQVGSAPFALFHSSLAAVPRSSNRTGYASAEADRLIERGIATTDPEAARGVWREFTELLQRDQPMTFMFWLDELAAARKRLQGVVMDPRGELVGIAGWWLPGGR